MFIILYGLAERTSPSSPARAHLPEMVREGESGGERDRDSQTDRQIDRQTDRQTDR